MKNSIRILLFALIAAIAAGTASTGTPSSASITAASFANSLAPNKVWDATNATDTKWAAGFAACLALFGPGADNTTVYAYGVAYTGSSSPYTGATITSRSINASLVSGSSDTKEASVITDLQATLTDTIQDTPFLCTGSGSLGMVYMGKDGSSNNQLHFAVVTGATVTTVTITSLTPASGTVYYFYDHQCWYDPVGTYYVAWTTQTAVTSGGTTTYTETAVNVQAVNATTVKALWSSAVSVTLTNPSDTGGGFTAMVAGGSGTSNVSSVYLAYVVGASTKSTSTTTGTISLTSVTVSSTAGTINTTKSAITTTLCQRSMLLMAS